MDSFQRALKNNEIFFSNYFSKFVPKTENFGRKLKNIQMNSEASILIKLQCVIYINGSSQRALQTNEFFFKFQISFRNFGQKPKKYSKE